MKWHGFRQVGNSILPLLTKAVATEIIHDLGIAPFKPSLNQELGGELITAEKSEETICEVSCIKVTTIRD